MKKIISALTALVMTCTVILGVLPVSAEETQSAQPSIENDISIEGTNSFGNLLTDSLDEKMDEQQANNGCNVFSAEVTGNEATVSFETTESCTLLVAVYDEAGEQMLASGSAEVTAEETEKTVAIETDSMPQYFYLRAFLVNTVTLRPLCTVYESPNYTQEMQEFFAKTVDDFDNEKVLNLDEDKTNNFAVYADGTKVIQSDGTVNKVAKADEINGIYIIENADSAVISLSAGDIFALEQPDGNVLIVKVGNIEVNGTAVTISEQNTSLEEVFDYVKIDESQGTDKVSVDNSELEDGVTFEGLVNDSETPQAYSSRTANASDYAYLPAEPELQAAEVDTEFGDSLSYKIAEKKIGNEDKNITVSSNIEIELKGSVKAYVSLSYFYLEMKVDYTAQISASISGNLKEASIPLGKIEFSPCLGVFIRFKPAIVFEATGTIELSGTLSSTIGFGIYSDSGYKNLSSTPSFDAEVKAEVTVFVGLSLEPELIVLSDKIAEAEIEAKIGAEIKAELPLSNNSSSGIAHTCKNCVEGEINGKLDVSFSAKLLNMKNLTYEHNLIDYTIKICDFYYSIDKNEFGWGTCPYQAYKVSVSVKDKNGYAVNGAIITSDGATSEIPGTTDKYGRLEMWCYEGKCSISASKNGLNSSRKITVNDNTKSVMLVLGKKFSLSGIFAGLDEDVSLMHYFNDHKYAAFNKQISWSAAEEYCEKLGGHLVTITSEEEQSFVVSITNNRSMWIGGYRNPSNVSEWKWVTDEPWDYTNWGDGEPNDSSNVIPNENCIAVWPVEWNDLNENSTEQHGFICEWDSEMDSKNSTYSANLSQISYLANEPALHTKNFTDLLPNEIYNFYLLKSSEENPLDSDNLLYAGQGVSDESGSLTVSYIPKTEYTSAVIYINSMTRTDLSGAKVTVPDILCNGEEQFAQPVVTLDGKTLEFGIDYDIEKDYSATSPGEYELIISAINDYTGEVSTVYNVYCEHSFENGKCTICGSLETDKGDVNGDGVTGIADIVALQKYIVRLKTDVAGNADVNGDGVVNVFDDVILKRMVL